MKKICCNVSDRLGPGGRWVRHKLLAGILAGVPAVVKFQVSDVVIEIIKRVSNPCDKLFRLLVVNKSGVYMSS